MKIPYFSRAIENLKKGWENGLKDTEPSKAERIGGYFGHFLYSLIPLPLRPYLKNQAEIIANKLDIVLE